MAVRRGGRGRQRVAGSSGPRESLEIHPVAVAAERNRLTGVPVPLWA